MKRLLLLFVSLVMVGMSYGQMSGLYNVPGDFPDLATAITNLNTVGVSANVTINLVAGNPQTAPAGGYSIGSATLCGAGANSSGAGQTVTITGNGNTITAFSTQTVGALNDAIFKILGADYITIQGFTMQENAANTVVTPAASNTMTEWGVAVLYWSATDGAKNITIQNNTISLNRLYNNSFGIYSNVRHSPTSISTTADITAPSGSTDNLKIYNNNISNVNDGIVVVGSTTTANMNNMIDVGGIAAGTGNTITNYGLTGTISSYVSVSGSVMGINLNNCLGNNVSYNTITCPGLNTAGTVYGLYMQATGTLPVVGGPWINTINYNNVSIKSGYASGAIYGLYNSIGNLVINCDINNNNYYNFGHTVTGTGSIYCQYISGGSMVLNIKNNTFTALNVNTTGSVYLIYANATLPVGGVQTCDNNSIVTSFTKTGAGGTVYCYYNYASSPATANDYLTNNNFQNISLAGSATFYGAYFQDGGAAVKVASGNTFAYITGGTGSTYVLYPTYGTANIFNNTIHDITCGGTFYGIYGGNSSTTTQSIYSNSIYSITSSGASSLYGIYTAGSSSPAVTNIYKNKICDITGSNASSLVNGIYISAGTTINIYNNYVGNLFATAATGLNAINGIYASATATYDIYYNTIYLNATSSSTTTFGTSDVYFSSSATSFSMRDNILANFSAPAQNGTNIATNGISACLRRSTGTTGTVPANYAVASNNNAYWCISGALVTNHLSYVEGTSTVTNPMGTVAQLKAFMITRDQASVEENPPFINTTCGDAMFLHINPATATQLESGGVYIAGDDFDGNTRNNPPDIGADEFDGTPQDLTPPIITYVPLTNTASLLVRSLKVTITDASGVGTGANAPVLYWMKTGDAGYTGPVAVALVPPQSGSDYYFDLGTGVVAGDVVSYFVVAQDIVGNVGSAPGGATVTANPPLMVTPPASPSTYTIIPCISGDIEVGTGKTYTTLTAAIAALNGAELCGPLKFILTDATYTPAAMLVINRNSGSSATNTVTIVPGPAKGPVTITGTVASGPVIKILNDYTIIDGSTSGGTDRSLTIVNASVTSPSVVVIGSTGTTQIVGATVKNTILINGVNTSSAMVVSDGATAGTAGYFNNITLQNNSIQKAYIGIYSNAVVATGNGSILITQNDLNTIGANAIRYVGIYAGGIDRAVISKNNVGNFDGTTGEDDRAIWLASGTKNSTVEKNYIFNLNYLGTGGYGGRGIVVSSGLTACMDTLRNNMIYNITGDGYTATTDYIAALDIFSTQTGVKIYHNSINLYGNTLNYTSATSYGIFLGTGSTADITDNIIVNNLGLLSGTGIGSVGVFLQTDKTQLEASDYNDIWVNPSSGVKYVGEYGTTGFTTLGTWAGYTLTDGMSVSDDPKFVLNTNLHIQTTAISVVSDAGIAGYAGVLNDDIDNEVRSNPPDIGADTYTYAPPLVDPPSGVTATVMSPIQVKIDFNLNGNGNNVAIAWNTTGIFTAPTLAPGAPGDDFAGGKLLSYGTTSPVYHACAPQTHYYYMAYSYDLTNYSSGIMVDATTPCGAFTGPFPFTESFDGTTFVPDCWTLTQVSGTGNWARVTTGSTGYPSVTVTPHTGAGEAYFNCYSFDEGTNSAMITPAIVFPTGGYQVTFWMYRDGGYSTTADLVNVYYNAAANLTGATLVGTVNRSTALSPVVGANGWYENIMNLPSGASGTQYIIFEGVSAYGNNIFVDDINIDVAPPCPAPTTLTAAPGNVYASLGWTPGDVESDWEIEWGPSTFTHLVDGTIVPVNTSTPAPPYLLEGLTASTPYKFYVRANCGSGLYSTWTGPFNFTTLVACPPPTNLEAKNIQTTKATLTWVEHGTATGWNIEYGLNGYTHLGAGATLINGVSKPYILGDPASVPASAPLTSGTAYTFYVQSDCSSTWAGPYSFTTLCENISSFPWNEGFESTTVNNLPPCWAKTTGSTWIVTNNASSTYDADAHIGAQFLRVNWTSGTSYVWTPAFNLTANTQYDLTFWWAGDAYSGWDGSVYYNTLQDPTGATVMGAPFVTNTQTTTKTYAQILRQFTPDVTGVYYFAVQVTSSGSPWYLSFDDFRLEPTPPCVAPTDLAAVPALNSADLSWNANGTTAWEIEWKEGATFTQGTGTTIGVLDATNPYTLGGLSSSTTYSYYVRAFCDPLYSSWAGPFAFTTLCGAMTPPYTQNFDGVTAPTLPNCMLVTDDNADLVKWTNTNTTLAYSLPNAMRIGYNSSADMDDWFFSPGLNLAAGTYKVSFKYRSSGTYYAEALEVKWGSTQDAAGMTNGPVFDDPAILTATYLDGSGLIVVGAPGVYYVGFHGYSVADMYYLLVDDINIALAANNDMATSSVDLGSMIATGIINPTATVKNNGLLDQIDVPVTMTIDCTPPYSSTIVVPSILAGQSLPVTFDPWTATVGSYTVEVCTELTGDEVPTNDCMSKTVAVEVLTKFYAYNTFTAQTGYFFKEHPGTWTGLASGTSDEFYCAGTWANGIWYASEYRDNVTNFDGGGWYSIDMAGVQTKIAQLDRSFTGITYDHTTNIMYGVDYDEVADLNNLYTIIPTTGVATLIGTVAPGDLLINLATDGSGTLYSLGLLAGDLYSINPVGPTFTDLGSTGLAINYAQDMEYDYDGATMYAAAYTTTGSLYTVPLVSPYTAVLVGGFAGGAEMCAFAIPYGTSTTKTLHLTSVFIEGLYQGFGEMFPASDGYGPKWPDGSADHIYVELHSATAYTDPVIYADSANLSTTGTADVVIPSEYSDSYYITIKHRNSIETMSALPQPFADADIYYAFDEATQAFDANMTTVIEADETTSPPLIFSGDVNQDTMIEAEDLNQIGNAADAFDWGYIVTDVYGDGMVEAQDLNITGNNADLFVYSHYPY